MPSSAPHMSCSLSTGFLDLRNHHVNLLIYQPTVELKVWSKDDIRNQAVLRKKKKKGNESAQFIDRHDLDGYSFIQNNYVNKNWHETHGNVHIKRKEKNALVRFRRVCVCVCVYTPVFCYLYLYVYFYISLKVAYLILVLCADEISWTTF